MMQPVETERRHRLSTMIDIRWLAGGIIIVLILLVLLAPLPVRGAAPEERHITVSANGFAFEPGTVRVNRGDTVTLELESTDVVHGLYLDGYGVATQAEPGRPGHFTFTADRSGAFRFRCNVACGGLHPFMIGKLVVGPNVTWLRVIAATLLTALGAMLVFWPRRPLA